MHCLFLERLCSAFPCLILGEFVYIGYFLSGFCFGKIYKNAVLYKKMKKKVLVFYGILGLMALVLMSFQIVRYGSLTGYLTSANVFDERVVATDDKGHALSLFEPSKIFLSSGSGKTSFLKVLNSGTSNLVNCLMKGEGELGRWIVPDSYLSLRPGESAVYSFSVEVSSEVEEGRYNIPFVFFCEDYERKGVFDVEVKDGSEGDLRAVTSSLTGFSVFEDQKKNSSMIIFVLIGGIFVALVGVYLHRRHRKTHDRVSKVEGYNRKFIKLDLSS